MSTPRRALCAAFAVSVILAAPRARAAEKITRMAVLEVKAAGVDQKQVEALSALVASDAASFPVKVIAGSDLQAVLGFERQKQLLGCTDSNCLAELGGALGVEYLLLTEVGLAGGRWLITVNLLDAVKGTSLKRLTKKTKSQSDLVDLTSEAVAEVMNALPVKAQAKVAAAPEPAKAEPVVAKPEPAKAEPAKPAPEVPPAATAEAEAEKPGNGRKIAGYALLGVGAGALVAGAVAGGLALAQSNSAQRNPPSAEALSEVKGSIRSKAIAADALYLVGALAAGTGLVLWLTAPSSTPESPAPSASVGFGPVQGGGALVVSGGF